MSASPPRLRADELFDAAFLESLATLRIVARRVPPGGRFADQRSKDLGHGIEFRDFRPYTPGDDPRSIDWNIYRRLRRVVLRLYEEWEDLPLYLLPDVSSSMLLEEPPRIVACLRTALALAAISLGQHDSVGVFPLADGLRTGIAPRAGKRRVHELAQRLASLALGGPTRTRQALETFARLPLRSGLCVVLSDFLDPAGIDDVLQGLARLRHRLMLVQLGRHSDAEPELRGDLRLVDCESGEAADVSIDQAVLARYREARAAHQAALEGFARSRGIPLLPIDCDQPIVAQLAAVFEQRSLVV